MICESCKQNLATVHLTEIVQKQKKELHLCEDCAREKGDVFKGHFSVHDFLGGLAEAAKGSKGAKKTEEKKAKAPDIAPCPACGLTFPEFKSSGRLGCHNDYEHFKKELLPLLEKIHGATQHTGRVPGSVGQKIETQKVLTALRKDLNLAIQREEYERAAELRDKIKTLEPRSSDA
ncbi:MAG TPA: UvrB/UvrC motif-containing protein [Planctomycetota bacterium]|nr:UvrB/UvrC motif-containing protein [Planctomycetota bacterium]